MSNKTKLKYRVMYTVLLFLMGLAVGLIPFSHPQYSGVRLFMILNAVLFWCSFVGIIVVMFRIRSIRTKCREKNNYHKFSAFRFFSNPRAALADVLLFISVAGAITYYLITYDDNLLIVFCGIILFFFGMHLFLNSNDYLFLSKKN